MNTKKLLYPVSEMGAGLMAPLDSLRFLAQHKGMLAALLAVHLAFVGAYFLLIFQFALPHLDSLIGGALKTVDGASLRMLLGWFAQASVVIVAILAYPLVGLPLVGIAASPIFDWVSQRAFEETAGVKLPTLSVRAMIRSLVFEVVRLAMMLGLIVLVAFSWVLVVLVPVVFILSLWFFGWDHVDRTLAVAGLGARRRLLFGVRHFVGCVSLGVWSYVPIFSFLLSPVMVASGGILAARLMSPSELERLTHGERR